MRIYRPYGFSLVEVLIAFALVTQVLLAMISLQNIALRQVANVYWQSVAIIQGHSLIERFRANDHPANWEQEFNDWLQAIPHLLPEGSGDYQCSTIAFCIVHVYWQAQGHQTVSLNALI